MQEGNFATSIAENKLKNLEKKTKLIEGDDRIVFHVGKELPEAGSNFLMVTSKAHAQGYGIYCSEEPDLRYSGGEKFRVKLDRTPIYCLPLHGKWRQGTSGMGYPTYHTEGRAMLMQDLKYFDHDRPDGKKVRYYYSLHPVLFKEPKEFWGGDFADTYREGKYTFEDVIPDLMKNNGENEERVDEQKIREELQKAVDKGVIPLNEAFLHDINTPITEGRIWISQQDKRERKIKEEGSSAFQAEQAEDQPIIDQRTNMIADILAEMSETHHAQPNESEADYIDEQETVRLRKIKQILDLDLDDGLFVQRLDEMRRLLPSVFTEMKGMEQTPPHRDIDPVDHTINTLSLLSTSDLSAEDRQAARATLLFHDVGKVFDPMDRVHPRRSVEIAESYLTAMGYDQKDTTRILQQIKWHDALGDVARRDGRSIFDPHDVMAYFPNSRELQLHKAIVNADVHSIPGLKKYLGDVDAIHRLMENRMYAERKWIEPNLNQQVPFGKMSNEQMAELAGIYEDAYFDDIDIRDNMRERQDTFNELPAEQQEQIRKMIVQCALENNEHALFSLKLTGRETDRTLVEELERQYGVNLDNLRISQELFNMTYGMWELNRIVQSVDPSDEGAVEDVRHKLQELMKSAHFLSAYQIEATHVTRPQFEEAIEESQALVRSDSGDASHYEGDGVYTGILGSYREWDAGKVYTMKVPLADSLPIIVNFNNPHAMTNMLGEMLHIKDEGDQVAVTHGLRQYRQCEYSNAEMEQWKIDLLADVLKAKPIVTTDENGDQCLIMDTDRDAIVWGSLMRALRIRRFVPLSELSKTNLPEEVKTRYIEKPLPQEKIVIEEPVDPYVDMANKVRAIKGLRAKELPGYELASR